MERGAVLGDRYQMKWQPDAQPMRLGIWATGHGIGTWKLFTRPRVRGLCCERCRKIVLDEDE